MVANRKAEAESTSRWDDRMSNWIIGLTLEG